MELKRRRTIPGRMPGGLSRAARRDANEPEIVEALRRAGAIVLQIDGRDIPDLLVGVRGKWLPLEVKLPLGPNGGCSEKGQHLSEGQEAFFLLCGQLGLPAEVVRTPEDALRAVGLLR